MVSESSATLRLPERNPRIGELVRVRSRTWLVDDVIEPTPPGESPVVRLACADDDAQGQPLEVYWNYEIDRLILEEERWDDLASRGFDAPSQFAAFLHTIRWGCVTATDPNLFQAPFRALRDEVLARLLELNAERAQEEARTGAAAQASSTTKKRSKRKSRGSETGDLFQ